MEECVCMYTRGITHDLVHSFSVKSNRASTPGATNWSASSSTPKRIRAVIIARILLKLKLLPESPGRGPMCIRTILGNRSGVHVVGAHMPKCITTIGTWENSCIETTSISTILACLPSGGPAKYLEWACGVCMRDMHESVRCAHVRVCVPHEWPPCRTPKYGRCECAKKV